LVYKRFHWGNEPERVTAAQAPHLDDGEVLVVLGELESLCYDTMKGGTDAIWCHKFKHKRPLVCTTADGRLVLVGGDYSVTARGIVG
jgi:hypothetical protein